MSVSYSHIKRAGSGGGGSATAVVPIADTPPASPVANQLFWDSVLGKLFVWYDDGNSAQWVPASPVASGAATTLGVPVERFGAVGDGVTDDTAALQAALNTGHAIFLSKGNYLVTDMLTVPYGSGIFGETKQLSKIIVPVTFNLSAQGVVLLSPPPVNGNEQSGMVRDLSIEFNQPDSSARSTLVHYPPAIYARSATRSVIQNVRIVRGWTGIWMDGTPPSGSIGGCMIDNFEASCFSRSIYIEDALDAMHLSRVHLWNFGCTANQNSAMWDGTTVGLECGRVDALIVTDFFALAMPKAIYLRSGTGNFPGLSSGQLANIMLDDGGMVVAAGTFNVSNLYTTSSTVTARTLVVQPDSSSGAWLTVTSFSHRVLAANATPEVVFVGSANSGPARLVIAGMLFYGAAYDRTAIKTLQTGGVSTVLNLANAYFDRASNNTYTNSTIWIASGRGALTNITTNDKGTGGGNLIQIDTDDWITISNVIPVGWVIALPATALSIDHDVNARVLYTPVVTAAAGTLTTYSAAGRYTRRGKFLKIMVTISITTNGTGSGAIIVTLPGSFSSAADQVLLGRESTSSGFSLLARIPAGGTTFTIWDYKNTYPAGNGFTLNFNGEIEIQ